MRAFWLMVVLGIIGCSSSSSSDTSTGGQTSGGATSGGSTSGTTSGTTTGSSFNGSAAWKQDSKSYTAVPTCTSFSASPFSGQVMLGTTVVMNFQEITLDSSTDAGMVVTGTGDCQGRGGNCVEVEWQSQATDAGCQYVPGDCDDETLPCPISCRLNGSTFSLKSGGQSSGGTIVTGTFAIGSNQCWNGSCGDTGSGSHTASGTFTCLW